MVYSGHKMLEINKIYNEDCLIGLKKLDSDVIDLTVTAHRMTT